MNSSYLEFQEVFSRLMAVLHLTIPQPLQITPALQESRVGPPVAVNINICGYP